MKSSYILCVCKDILWMGMWMHACRKVCTYMCVHMCTLLYIFMCGHEHISTICMLSTWLLMRMYNYDTYCTIFPIIIILSVIISYLFIYLFLHIMLCIGTCQVVVGFTKPVGGYESIQVPDRYTIVQYHDISIFTNTHWVSVC